MRAARSFGAGSQHRQGALNRFGDEGLYHCPPTARLSASIHRPVAFLGPNGPHPSTFVGIALFDAPRI